MWFSKVPGYIFDKQRPYLTKANELSSSITHELVAYGVFVGTIYAIIGLAIFKLFENTSSLFNGY